jgi:hypothetical protein
MYRALVAICFTLILGSCVSGPTMSADEATEKLRKGVGGTADTMPFAF